MGYRLLSGIKNDFILKVSLLKIPQKKSSNGKPIGTPHVQATPHVSRFLSYKIHSSSKASFILNTPSSQLSPIDPRCELLKLSLSFFCFRPSVCFSRKSINQEFSFSLSLRAKKKNRTSSTRHATPLSIPLRSDCFFTPLYSFALILFPKIIGSWRFQGFKTRDFFSSEYEVRRYVPRLPAQRTGRSIGKVLVRRV